MAKGRGRQANRIVVRPFSIAGFLHVRSAAQGISSDQTETETETFKSSGVHFS